MGFLSLGVVLLAGVEVGATAGCDADGCDELPFVEAVFAAEVLAAVDLEPLCFSVGRSGSSEGADASGVLWFVSEEDAAGVGAGEAAGDALSSGRCRVGRPLSDDSEDVVPDEDGVLEAAGVGEGVALLSGRRRTGRSLSVDDEVDAGALEDESLPEAR